MNKEEKNSNKCPICGRPTHKESKYCIFHASAEEKNEKEFKKVLKEYINSIKKENKNYDFRRFIFIGEISFKKDLNVTIFKNAIFSEATFKGSTDFRGATFEEYTSFGGVTFERDVDFMEATFKDFAIFMEASFKGNADFMEATFDEYADFMEATFERDANFGEAIFKEY